MYILLINKFLYPKGGEAVYTLNLGELLGERGHKVIYWGMDHPQNPIYPYSDLFVSYHDFNELSGFIEKLKAGINILYSLEAKEKIEKLLKRKRPDIVHLNNIYHQISPSILDIFARHDIPTVMTLHDYKLVCPSYMMMVEGKICEKCKEGRYYWCFLKKCTKSSYLKSLLNTFEMYLHHKILHIYDKVNVFIAPSMFLKSKIEEMGFGGKLVHLPNFINLDRFEPSYSWEEKTMVYFGRLSPEKGLFTLLKAVNKLKVRLKIIGEGPIRRELEKKAGENVYFLGYMPHRSLKGEIKKAMAVVLPSEWYENYPFSILESFALGKPVIGSAIGGIPELITNGKTGFLFEPGNVEDLADKISQLMKDRKLIKEMGKYAREKVEQKCSPETHYEKLMKIYKSAIRKHNKYSRRM